MKEGERERERKMSWNADFLLMKEVKFHRLVPLLNTRRLSLRNQILRVSSSTFMKKGREREKRNSLYFCFLFLKDFCSWQFVLS